MQNFKKGLLKKICHIFISAVLLFSNLVPASAFSGGLVADYLVELGRHFYEQGNYSDALQELKKAVILNSNHQEALHYIELIQRTKKWPGPPQDIEEHIKEEGYILKEREEHHAHRKEEFIKDTLDKVEQERGRASSVLPVKKVPEKPAEAIEKATVAFKVMPPIVAPVTGVPEKPTVEKPMLPKVLPQPVPATKELPKKTAADVEIEKPFPVIAVPAPIAEKRGEIKLFIDGQEVFIEKPVLIKGETILLPLRETASKLYFSVLDLKGGIFKLISPEGVSTEIKVSIIDGEPMLREDELKKYFSVDTYFDSLKKAFHIRTKFSPQFKAYVQEKPETEIKQEMAQQEITKKAAMVPEKPAVIPKAARPSVQLRWNTSYTYTDFHILPTFHSLISSLSGRAYDFDVRYQGSWKDINGVFDHDYTYLNLTRPELFIGLFDQYIDLYPLRSQSERFTGLKIIKGWEEGLNKTDFWGGETENTASGTSGSVKYLGKIYGVGEQLVPLEWLSLKSALLYLENRADIPSLAGTTSFPRHNLVSFLDSYLKLPYDLTLSTAVARSEFEPDNAPGAWIEDWDWRVGTEINKKRYKLGLAYEFVGDQYASLGNPASYQDYSGWNLYSNYKVTDKWALSSSLMRYNNNVDDDPAKITTKNLTYSLSSYHRLTQDQWVNLNFSHFTSDPSGPNPGLSNKSNLYRIDYSLPFFFETRSLLNYQYYRNDTPETGDFYSHTAGATLFKTFGKSSTWFLAQQFTETFNKSSADNLNSITSFNINYVLNPALSLYHNYSYSHDEANQERATDTISESTGFKYRILPDTNVNVEHNVSSYNLKTEKHRWPRNWSIRLYVSQGFDLSTPPNFGIIEGSVFKDINSNGKVDLGEEPVEGVHLYLPDKRETTTNPEGYYKFRYITPGKQSVYLDVASLPGEWAPAQEEQEIEVRPRRKNKLNFYLIKTSLVSGKVFIDNNQNNVFEAMDEPLDGVAIMLLPDTQLRRTNSDGDFKFDYLMPGKYKIKIKLEDFPVGYDLVSQEEVELEFSGGKEIKDINFVVRLKPPPAKE